MRKFINPFAGLSVGADWDWHKAHDYQGGTDYKTYVGRPTIAAVSGIAYNEGNGTISIVYAVGRKITYRHQYKVGIYPRAVVAGKSVIGKAGLDNLWAHIEQWVFGERLPFEPLPARYKAHLKRLAEKKQVRKNAAHLNRRGYGFKTAASRTGVPDAKYWQLVQTWGVREEIYDHKPSGRPGPLTDRVEAALSRHLA